MTTTPTTAEVAQLIADRVLTGADVTMPDFSAVTVPTAAQVTAIIPSVVAEVHAEAGDIPTTPEDLEPFARFVAAQGVAAWVLNSWFSDDPQGPELQRIYEENRARLAKAVDAVNSGGDLGAGQDESLPVFNFPDTSVVPVTGWDTQF